MSDFNYIDDFIQQWIADQSNPPPPDATPAEARPTDGPYRYFGPRLSWLTKAIALDKELDPKLFERAPLADVVYALSLMLMYLCPEKTKIDCSLKVLQREISAVTEFIDARVPARGNSLCRIFAAFMAHLVSSPELGRKCPKLAYAARAAVQAELLHNTEYAIAVVTELVRSYPRNSVDDLSQDLAQAVFSLLLDGKCPCCVAIFNRDEEDLTAQQMERVNRCARNHSFAAYSDGLTKSLQTVSLRDFLRTAVVGGQAELFTPPYRQDDRTFNYRVNGLQAGMLFTLLQELKRLPVLRYAWLLMNHEPFPDCDAYQQHYWLVDPDSGNLIQVEYFSCVIQRGEKMSYCGRGFVPRPPTALRGQCRTNQCAGHISNRKSRGYLLRD